MQLRHPTGIQIHIPSSLPPASIGNDDDAGSADIRFASTPPALPAPMMTQSKCS